MSCIYSIKSTHSYKLNSTSTLVYFLHTLQNLLRIHYLEKLWIRTLKDNERRIIESDDQLTVATHSERRPIATNFIHRIFILYNASFVYRIYDYLSHQRGNIFDNIRLSLIATKKQFWISNEERFPKFNDNAAFVLTNIRLSLLN